MTIQGKVLLELLKTRKHSVGCEIGIHTGETTDFLLRNLPNIETYYAIDPWKIYKMYNGSMYRKPSNKIYKSMKAAFKKYCEVIKPFENKVVTYKMTSVDASRYIPENSLDWVFIDANHEYEYIKENLRIWSAKVKPGGLVSGHDYGNKWKGIKKAVNEFVPLNKLSVHPHYVWSYVREVL